MNLWTQKPCPDRAIFRVIMGRLTSILVVLTCLAGSTAQGASLYDPALEWGFVLDHNRSFANFRPGAWAKITKADSGQFYDSGALFTFDTVYPLLDVQKSNPRLREAK